MQKRRKTKHFWKFDATSAQNCEMWTLEHTPFAIECLAIYKDKLALNSWRALFFLSLAKIYTILNHKTCHRRRCNVCTLLLPPVSFLPLFFRDFFSQKLQEFILYIFFSSHTQRKKSFMYISLFELRKVNLRNGAHSNCRRCECDGSG